MSRTYNKKSPYWETRKNVKLSELTPIVNPVKAASPFPDVEYQSFGQEALAGFCDSNNSTSLGRNPQINGDQWDGAFPNLDKYFIPYDVVAQHGYLSIANAINLCQKAYVGFAPFRNTIETLVEFCNTKVHLKAKDDTSRKFIEHWFNKIGLAQLQEQYFREYHRSGNVFLYRYDGELTDADYKKIKQSYGAKTQFVPIRYIILNPTNIFVQSGITNRFTYVKMLSTYELERLKAPQTEEEKQLFQDLPDYIQKFLLSSGAVGLFRNIYIPIDPYRLYYVFYKKQPYEPLAIPMGFPLLKDIEYKLQLKKTDIALTKSLEFAMLLLTTGEPVNQYGGGINPNNVKALQTLFANNSVGRVLVADYTTKAQWVIPDIKDLLGDAKYKEVDKDIEEGLQNILLGEQKFATASLKAKFFLKKIESAQKYFIDEFLQPEINRLCEAMGFKDVPLAYFEKTSLQDDVQMNRVYTRLAELGILSPSAVLKAMETNILPDDNQLVKQQEEFKEMRDEGFYEPLIGGGKNQDQAGRPSGSTGIPQSKKKISPIGTGGSEKFSTKKIVENMNAFDSLKISVAKELKKQYKVKKLTEEQESIAKILIKHISVNENTDKWQESIASYLKEPKEISQDAAEEIEDIAVRHQIDSDMALLLYKSKL